MRKALWVLAVVGGCFFVAVVVLRLISHANRSKMLAAPPLTVEAIERLAADNAMSPTRIADASAEASSPQAPRELGTVPPLRRAATREEALVQLGAAKDLSRGRAHIVLALADTLATACGLAGISSERGGWYCEAGQEAEKLRDMDLAQSYFREALRYPTHEFVREWCLSRLAWYEQDSNVASAAIEASCASDNPLTLNSAVRLAHLTGSTEACIHYLDRLRAIHPDSAETLAHELGIDLKK